MNRPTSTVNDSKHDVAVACIATPAGRSAVATVLAQGSRLSQFLENHFQPVSQVMSEQLSKRPRFGYWIDGDFREEVVIGWIEASSDDASRDSGAVEIHCHGGRIPASRILESFVVAGYQQCTWETWHRLRGADSISAEAVGLLANARTERTAWILLDQVQGAWLRDYQQGERWLAEGRIDALSAAISRWQSLLPAGRRLSKPARVVLAGPPNVGKSSLLNRLVGFERAIVFDQPGTTRDSLWVTTAIDGWEFEFWDTAGIRETDDAIEWAGVQMSQAAIEQADLVLWISEAINKSTNLPQTSQSIKIVPVANKSDLLPNPATDRQTDGSVTVSARTGAGLEQLLKRIRDEMVPVEPRRGESVPFSDRLQRWVLDLAKASAEDLSMQANDGAWVSLWRQFGLEFFHIPIGDSAVTDRDRTS